jgi:hypothetical protein
MGIVRNLFRRFAVQQTNNETQALKQTIDDYCRAAHTSHPLLSSVAADGGS